MANYYIRPLKLLPVAFLLLASDAWAITTDRPDVAESSFTVPRLRVQLEIGGDISFSEAQDVLSIPTKVRLGLFENFEIHLESGILSAPLGDGDVTTSDVAVGGKIHIFDADGLPSVGVLTALSIPTEGSIVSLKTTLAVEQDLVDRLGLALNVYYLVQLSQREQVTLDALGYAVALGFDAVPQWNVGVYAEAFGEVLFNGGDGPINADGGITYSPTETLQFDLYGRFGLVNTDRIGDRAWDSILTY